MSDQNGKGEGKSIAELANDLETLEAGRLRALQEAKDREAAIASIKRTLAARLGLAGPAAGSSGSRRRSAKRGRFEPGSQASRVIDAVNSGSRRPTEVAEKTGIPYHSACVVLQRLARDGHLSRLGHGVYAPAEPQS